MERGRGFPAEGLSFLLSRREDHLTSALPMEYRQSFKDTFEDFIFALRRSAEYAVYVTEFFYNQNNGQ
jgi:hypothetical protein